MRQFLLFRNSSNLKSNLNPRAIPQGVVAVAVAATAIVAVATAVEVAVLATTTAIIIIILATIMITIVTQIAINRIKNPLNINAFTL